MPVVRMPDNALVRFPDEMPASEIRSLIQQKFPDETGAPAAGTYPRGVGRDNPFADLVPGNQRARTQNPFADLIPNRAPAASGPGQNFHTMFAPDNSSPDFRAMFAPDGAPRKTISYEDAVAQTPARKTISYEEATQGGVTIAPKGGTPTNIPPDIGAAAKAWRGFSDPERKLFKIGFISKLMDTVSSVPDRADVVRKIWGNDKSRRQIMLAVGPHDARELEAFMGVESAMDLARKSLGNSTTVRQLAEAGIAGGTGYGLTTGDWNPKDVSIAALLAAGGRRAGIKINDRVVRAVADKLISSDPTVYQQGIGIVARNPKLMAAVRGIAKSSGAIAGQQSLPAR